MSHTRNGRRALVTILTIAVVIALNLGPAELLARAQGVPEGIDSGATPEIVVEPVESDETPIATDEVIPDEVASEPESEATPAAPEAVAEPVVESAAAPVGDEQVSLAATSAWSLSSTQFWKAKWIVVSLRGFAPNTPITLKMIDSIGNKQYLGHDSSGPTGDFDWNLRIPTNSWVINGSWQVEATIDGAGWPYTELGRKAVTVVSAPAKSLTFNRNPTTVNTNVTYTVSGLSPNSTVELWLQRAGGSEVLLAANVRIDANGQATGLFKVPYTPGGVNTIFVQDGGMRPISAPFEVRPRIKVMGQAIRGALVDVSLAGYGKKEVVRVRWKVGNSWVSIGSVVTSNTGSYKGFLYVPNSAALGFNSVRGDGTIWRQQTNAVEVIH